MARVKTTKGVSGPNLGLVKEPKGINEPESKGRSNSVRGERKHKRKSVATPITHDDATAADKQSNKALISLEGEKADSKVKRRTRSSGNGTTLDDTPTLKKHKKTVPKQGSDNSKDSGQKKRTKGQNPHGEVSVMKTKEHHKQAANETPFRSSLGSIMTVIKALDLRECHKKVLRETPFWAIFEAIIDKKVTATQCRKSDKMIIEIIDNYDPDEGKFRLGRRRQLLELTRVDMVKCFGIKCGNEYVSLQHGCKESVSFVARRGIEDKRLTTTNLKQLLSKYVASDSKVDVEDVGRLLCLYLLHTFFFPMGIYVKWVLFERVDDLERMGRYDWNRAIIKELMSSIKKYHLEPRKVTGCVMALLYWLCEHTTVTKALHPKHPLGIVKWSIPSLVSKFKSVWLKDLKHRQVVSEVSHISGGRPDEEPEEKHIVQDTPLSGDVKVAKVSNTVYPYDGLHCEESMPSPSNNGFNVGVCVPDSPEHTDRIPHGSGLTGEQVNHRESLQEKYDSPAHDDNASVIKALREHIARLEEHIKEREAIHESEMKAKDEKILSLIAEGDQLWDEYAESVTHAVTQSVKVDPNGEEQRSLVRNLKSKKRKGTEKEDYVYPPTSKCQKMVPGESVAVVKEKFIDCDTYVRGPKKPASKLVPIKGARTNNVLRLLSSEDREKIDQIWQEANNSTSIWSGTRTNNSVYAEDLRSLIIETAITGNVIDAYSEFLLMEQDKNAVGTQLSRQVNDSDCTQGVPNTSSYVFTSSLLRLIAGKTNKDRIRTLGHLMPKTSHFRYLLFPIHHHYHWTLLVLDTEEGTWRFYNSLRPRTGLDSCLEAARQLKNQIDAYYKQMLDDIVCTQDCQDVVQVLDSPQQSPGSLDCGVIVCYIIRQHFRNEKVEPKFPKAACRQMRAEIIHAFINDELHSWNPQQQMDHKEHAVEAIKVDKKEARTRRQK